MATSLFLATTIGLFIATQTNGHWTVIRQALNDQPLTSLAISGEVVLTGSTDGMWRSTDKGKTWTAANDGLKIRYVRWLAAASTPVTTSTLLPGQPMASPGTVESKNRGMEGAAGSLPLMEWMLRGCGIW